MAKSATASRSAPPRDHLEPAIDRLRAIATRSYDNLLLAEGPPDPDYLLLDLCGDALHLTKQANKIAEERDASIPADPRAWTAEYMKRRYESVQQEGALNNEARKLLNRAAKLKATTPAGIYAKALLVRNSKTGAAVLAMSLAEELVECEGLRASLWPAREDVGA
jgi:hypothetical protein